VQEFFDNVFVRAGISAALGALAAIVITAVVAFVFRRIARRERWVQRFVDRVRRPFRIVLLIALVWVALAIAVNDADWRGTIDFVARILMIAAGAWLVASLALFFEDAGLDRYRIDVADNRVARRVRTQVLILRRLTVVVIVIVAIASILLTFPGAQAVGGSILASAGVVSIVAGLAAQSSLANVFAGMQLAFSDAIRVDDVVIVETEWGRVEEITLTYVVVHLWDDRRMVLPSTYFTSTPFQNWTRRNSELLGAVEFDLDWRVSPAQMREELDRVLAETELWDGRASVLQVTDAVGGYVRIRVLVTAVDAPTLFDLRCYVREALVTWLHETSPGALPRERVVITEPGEKRAPTREKKNVPTDAHGLFSGDQAAEERASLFTGRITTISPEEAALAADGSDRGYRAERSERSERSERGERGDVWDDRTDGRRE
jgi:small-conductance mechanosensitive channel